MLDEFSEEVNYDYFRHPLPGNNGLLPGQSVDLGVEIPSPLAKGKYFLVFDLVSELVCWFAHNGSQTVKKEITVGR